MLAVCTQRVGQLRGHGRIILQVVSCISLNLKTLYELIIALTTRQPTVRCRPVGLSHHRRLNGLALMVNEVYQEILREPRALVPSVSA